MILIADMCQPHRYDTAGCSFKIKRKFEALTGHPCVVMNYPDVNTAFVERYGIQAIFITGTGYGWETVEVSKLHGISDLMRQTQLPVYGACGGHQLLGFIFNKNLRRVKQLADEPMRKLRRGEPDWHDSYRPGYFTERGMHPIKVLEKDPLFTTLPKTMWLHESHYCEVKKVPKDFVLLASSENCRIQVMRHADRPIYGCQFHAENWTDAYPHGKKLMENFFSIAGLRRT
ncbi:MAG: gamma-glutamyl-gamma-aminobutyrate hydrolase family protein [Lentisphaeria bacterium]|nr:gamma-glutamyl-gamma-aminobutyrate hydrolase family protein [Lentisphaeria bacterium]